MEYVFKDIVKNLDHQELSKVLKDIEKGGIETKQMIKEQISELEKTHGQYCSVCANDMDPKNVTNFTLIFGPEGFKKKASFCAIDCMKYFVSNLEDLQKSCVK